MAIIADMLKVAKEEGYRDDNADAKVCQDIVLKALAESSLNRNVTIKGGVVMRGLSNDSRRATQDMDIDFIRYSLSDESIMAFVQKLNCLPNIRIEQYGDIEELRQQDYHGKRIFVRISDDSGEVIESKIDLGVHKHLSIEQEEFCFDIACFDDGASLLVNSKEQMFTEKLRSLLKFGGNSTRFKDIFDMCYLTDFVDVEKLQNCFAEFIFNDSGMRENNMQDIIRRAGTTFADKRYVNRLSHSRKNWLGMPVESVLDKILGFLEAGI